MKARRDRPTMFLAKLINSGSWCGICSALQSWVVIVVILSLLVFATVLVFDRQQLDLLRLHRLALPERQPGEGVRVGAQIAEDVVSQSADKNGCEDQGSDEVGINLVLHVEVFGCFGWFGELIVDSCRCGFWFEIGRMYREVIDVDGRGIGDGPAL
jgi:hypothetical protein